MKYHSSKLVLVFITALVTLFLYHGLDFFKTKNILVGANQWIGYESLHLYELNKRDNSKSFKIVEFPNSTKVIQAFKKGLIDIAALTLDEALILSQNVEDLVVFLVLDVSAGGDAIITLNDKLGIKDLENHKVGLELGAVGSYLISRAVELFKLDFQKIKTVAISNDNQESAILNNKVDFIITFNPVKNKLISLGGKVVFDSNSIPGEIVDILVTRKETIMKSHRQLINFTIELQKSMEKISLKDNSTLKIISNRTHVPISVVEDHIKDIQIPIGKDNLVILKRIFEVNIHKLEKVLQRSFNYPERKKSKLHVDFSIINESFKMERR